MSFAESYCSILDELDLNHSEIIAKDDLEMVYFGIDTKNVKSVRTMSIFGGPSVSVTCTEICKIPDDKFADALLICNELNVKYRFAKFFIDNDNELVIQADGFLDPNSAGEETWALAKATLDKVDEAYGKLMKAIWA